MKKTYIERAIDFIHDFDQYLVEAVETDGYGETHVSVFSAKEIVDAYCSCHKANIKVCNGVSRMAFIRSDYVVKIDFHNCSFVGGCESEFKLYQAAKAEGCEEIFAEITRYSTPNFNYYIMPRIRNIGKGKVHAERYMTSEQMAFCYKYDIDDLHSSNYGYTNGKITIIDYACNKFA